MNDLVPVYQQIKETIKTWIVDGVYKPSQKIPSESELIKEFGVSRLTIRQAVGLLVQEGYLVSKRGKGSFVTSDPEKLKALMKRMYGSIDDLLYHSERLKTRTAKIITINPSPMIRMRLGLSPKEELIQEVTRVRFSEDTPVVVTKSYMHLKYGKFLDEKKLKERPLIIGILEDEAGIIWRRVLQTIDATFADKVLAEQLGINSGSPILRVERIMMTARRKPIVLALSWFRADTFKYFDGFRVVHRDDQRKLVYEGFADNKQFFI
ncbi:GntR family transcriptional regulator [Thermodesulfobacteriota bacterium]